MVYQAILILGHWWRNLISNVIRLMLAKMLYLNQSWMVLVWMSLSFIRMGLLRTYKIINTKITRRNWKTISNAINNFRCPKEVMKMEKYMNKWFQSKLYPITKPKIQIWNCLEKMRLAIKKVVCRRIQNKLLKSNQL